MEKFESFSYRLPQFSRYTTAAEVITRNKEKERTNEYHFFNNPGDRLLSLAAKSATRRLRAQEPCLRLDIVSTEEGHIRTVRRRGGACRVEGKDSFSVNVYLYWLWHGHCPLGSSSAAENPLPSYGLAEPCSQFVGEKSKEESGKGRENRDRSQQSKLAASAIICSLE